MKTWLFQWIKNNTTILLNAGSLIGATAVTSLLGFVFWWLAARHFLPEDVGVASAAISAMMLLGSFCMLGFGTLLITELPRQPGNELPLIGTACIVVTGAGFLIGFLFAVIAPYLVPGFAPLHATLANVCTFAAGVSLTTVTLVVDQACIGILRGGLQLWRNTLFAAAKLLVLFFVSLWFAHSSGMSIYASWTWSNALSFLVFLPVLFQKRKHFRPQHLFQWKLVQSLGFAAIQHHLLNLTLQAPTLLLPILVTALLSAKMNAWFYVSWMLANFVFLIPTALTTVLHATNSAQQTTLSHKSRMTIALATASSAMAGLVLFFGTRQILGLFGGMYANQASWCLRILVLAAFPLIIKNHYISICRIQDRIISAMVGMIPGGVIEMAGAAIGAYLGGLTGLSLGWVIAIAVESLFMFPGVYKVIRPSAAILQPLNDEVYIGQESIWLIDTVVLPIIPRSRPSVKIAAIPKRPQEIEVTSPRLGKIHFQPMPSEKKIV
ncbi:lipopolysaccharide biosynthesis protein [Tengunoibacter tsumagoiensis]|uniref:Polysaccharide biosynthesis protein C-terminal domain-containing protein n=1 Tax=Tengunoibacter tsumagoiensis TaxID=2014871 RepID=A0A402A0I5_9CHLR|nr:oligosaccharide flippase family protein [Tengunoibacter tsumagoiensis]GCE12660.1 hypothetical protein KTT_25190 [Tengunoibacter tsumagoiensis]